MQTSPFIYGKSAEMQEFTDREVECERLTQNFLSLVNTMIISPRRWGKTSLVKRVSKQIISENKDIGICMLDMFNVRDESEFYTYYAQSLVKATSDRWEEWIDNARSFLSRLLPKVTFFSDNQSEISFGIEINEIRKNPDDIIELAETIAKAKGIKIIVCIDEFQQIGNFAESLSFQRKLRAHWQHHRFWTGKSDKI